jgi:hypothetical protein
MAIIEEIREHNPYVIDLDKLPETEWYVCHLKMPGVSHKISLICCYHPSSISYWYNDFDKLTNYFKAALE